MLEKEEHGTAGSLESYDEERSGHICKVCFEAPTAAVLLPCRHFCCKETKLSLATVLFSLIWVGFLLGVGGFAAQRF